MDNINRVAFPLFSNFQKQKKLLQKSIDKVLFYESLLIFPIIIGLIFTFDSVLKVVPGYYDKWSVSLFSFYFFSLSALFVSLASPFINLFNAIGKVMVSLAFMVLWTVLTWALIPTFIEVMGFNGISVAFFIMSLTFVFVVAKAKQYVSFSFLQFLTRALVPTLIMAVFLLAVRWLFLEIYFSPLLHVSVSVVGGAIIYFYVVYLRQGTHLFAEIVELVKSRQTHASE